MKYHECFIFSVSKDILKISYDRLATNIPNDGDHKEAVYNTNTP